MLPEPHSNPDDADRIAVTARRRRILFGDWEEDVREYDETHYRREGTEHLSFVKTIFNPLKNLTEQLSTLYDAPPVVTISSGPAQDVSAIVTTELKALWPELLFNVVGLNEALMRVDVLPDGEIVYRVVTPDTLRYCEAHPMRPDRIVALSELRYMKRPGGGFEGWGLERWDVSNPDRPVFSVTELDAEGNGVDATGHYFPTLGAGEYPYRDLEGRPVFPYALYHLRPVGGLFNPNDGEELVEGTIGLALSHSWAHHGAITNPSYPHNESLLACSLQEDAIYRNTFGGVAPASLTPDRLISKEGLHRVRHIRERAQRFGDLDLLSIAAKLYNAGQGAKVYPESPDEWQIIYQ